MHDFSHCTNIYFPTELARTLYRGELGNANIGGSKFGEKPRYGIRQQPELKFQLSISFLYAEKKQEKYSNFKCITCFSSITTDPVNSYLHNLLLKSKINGEGALISRLLKDTLNLLTAAEKSSRI